MAELETIGFGPCVQAISETEICEARVLYKVNKGGKVYHQCTGIYDLNSKACGASVQRHGPRAEQLIRNLVKQEEEKNDVQHVEQGQGPEVAPDARATGAGRDEPEPKKRGGIFSLE